MTCLRPHNHSTSSCEEEEGVTSRTSLLSPSKPGTSPHHVRTSSSVHFSISPESSQDLAYDEDVDDVFVVEEEFGSFMAEKSDHDLASQSQEVKRKKRSRARFKSSSSGESSTSKSPFIQLQRPSSIKKLIPRSFSGILRSSTSEKNFQDSSTNCSTICSLHEFASSLLHVYRNNSLPVEGLHGFHQKVMQLVRQGEGGVAAQWWRREVVPGGTRIVGVKVVRLKEEEERVRELVEAWRNLYTSILPLLLSLLSPLQDVDVRQDVLIAFRDTVVPYAALPSLACTHPDLLDVYSWPLTQMMLRLAVSGQSLGPCTCDLSSEATENYNLKQDVGEKLTNVGEEVARETGNKEQKRQEHKDNEAVEVLRVLLTVKTNSLDISPASFNQLLHLHHGNRCQPRKYNHHHRHNYHYRRHSYHNSRYFFSSCDIQALEEPWVPHRPSSYKTLEDLLKSAASR